MLTGYQSLGGENNLTQHNQLIKNLLYLIDEMAQEHDLLLLNSVDNESLEVAWRDLLVAAECVGQARALGTKIISTGTCNTISRIRLKYLVQKIEKSTAVVWAQRRPSTDEEQKLRALLYCIDTELMTTQFDIGVTDYFSLASKAIESLYHQFDTMVANVKP